MTNSRSINKFGENGVSYSLPFVLVTPLYLVFMLTSVEIMFLMLAKLGTMSAAFAAAETAVSWQSAEPADFRDQAVRRSACMQLAAFAGGRQHEIDTAGSASADDLQAAEQYAAAIQKYIEGTSTGLTFDEAFSVLKYQNADRRLTVDIDYADDARGPITVRVSFRAPLYLPVVSRFLDPDGKSPYEYPLTASATLPNDGPLSHDARLGIDYSSRLEDR